MIHHAAVNLARALCYIQADNPDSAGLLGTVVSFEKISPVCLKPRMTD
jgi:hypothetical protein